MKFKGYLRKDGKVGIRNHVVVMPGVICAEIAAKKIAAACDAVFLPNPVGCGLNPKDMGGVMDVLSGILANANVYGVLIVGLGCEFIKEEQYREAIWKKSEKPVHYVGIQAEGGLGKTIEKGSVLVRQLQQEAAAVLRTEADLSDLILGLECGGSDPTSGLASNPLIGQLSDLIVKEGGTSILSETTEFIGAEHILARRAATPEVHDRIYEIVHRYEKALQLVGEEVREGNPSPGNKAGGLTCLEEKSLGCIHKGGHSPVNAVYDYGKQVEAKQGLVIMDTPGNDPSSVAGMVAGGAQIVVFSTGRGTPTGNPLAPVIKITGNKLTYANMVDNIDVDASPIIYGTKTLEGLGDELLKLTQEVACGKQTKAESLGYTEMAIARVCNFV